MRLVPESRGDPIYPEIAYSAGDCLLCVSCAAAFPEGAIDLQRRPLPLDRLRCRRGGTCVEHCPGKGLRLIGRYYPAAKLAALASQDLLFYENSGGGVTLSGGEPTLYPHYQEALLQALKFKQIHVNLKHAATITAQPLKNISCPTSI